MNTAVTAYGAMTNDEMTLHDDHAAKVKWPYVKQP